MEDTVLIEEREAAVRKRILSGRTCKCPSELDPGVTVATSCSWRIRRGGGGYLTLLSSFLILQVGMINTRQRHRENKTERDSRGKGTGKTKQREIHKAKAQGKQNRERFTRQRHRENKTERDSQGLSLIHI